MKNTVNKALLAKCIDRNKAIIGTCDWKENFMSDKCYNKHKKNMVEHAEFFDGEFTELPVYTADSKIYYAGPSGIEKWMKGRCAFEVFCDNDCIYDEEGEQLASVEDWYFTPRIGLFAKMDNGNVLKHAQIEEANHHQDGE